MLHLLLTVCEILVLHLFELFASNLSVGGFWEAVVAEYQAAEPPTGFQGEMVEIVWFSCFFLTTTFCIPLMLNHQVLSCRFLAGLISWLFLPAVTAGLAYHVPVK